MLKLEHTSSLMLFFFLCFISNFNVGLAGAGDLAGKNPFTPKAFLIRYWNKQISNNSPKPSFLLDKASPLTAVESAAFTKLADQNALSTQLPQFCSSANLLCSHDLSQSLEKHGPDSNFNVYAEKNFTNYGTDGLGGVNSFANYSQDEVMPVDNFRRYSRDSLGHSDEFDNYALSTNTPDQTFHTYGTGASGSAGKFTNYQNSVNVPKLGFNSYSAQGNGREQLFTSYGDNSNAGDQKFASYGKDGNAAKNEFSSYGNETNVIGSTFSSYGQSGNGANDSFTSYGFNGNDIKNDFKNYGSGGNGAVDTFTSYRDKANVGDDSFQSYAKKSNAGNANFVNYGQSFNEGSERFSGYGKGGEDPSIGFKIYGVNTTFKDYAKKGVTFAKYINERSSAELGSSMAAAGGKPVNRWVEPGKFFRERVLKAGTVIPMPDIRDKMPKRSFLPRVISSKLPLSSSKIFDLKKIFHAGENSSMESMLTSAVNECERAPSAGETKRCVGSVEDMIDFVVSVLGRNVVVRTTKNTHGSKSNVMIGSVKGINGGKVTESVSCHQSLFPSLLYYCHSVPKVRVYEADLLDPKTKSKINHGVAICHVDTSTWGASHGAFMALGSSPGKIEVCHWIFENDMTWAIAD